MWGCFIILPKTSGLRILTQDMYTFGMYYYSEQKTEADDAIQSILSSPPKVEADGLDILQKEYTQHKRRYLKHLIFVPEETGLSEEIFC